MTLHGATSGATQDSEMTTTEGVMRTPTTPGSPEQRMDALRRANEIRIGKARLKQHLKTLDVYDAARLAADIIENEPYTSITGALTVEELVRACPYLGESALRRVLRHAGIVTGKRKLRDLTARQREALALTLRERRLLWPNTRLAGWA